MLAGSVAFLKPGGLVYVEVPDGEAAAAHGPDREEFIPGALPRLQHGLPGHPGPAKRLFGPAHGAPAGAQRQVHALGHVGPWNPPS